MRAQSVALFFLTIAGAHEAGEAKILLNLQSPDNLATIINLTYHIQEKT